MGWGGGSLARQLPPESSRGQGSWHWVQREMVETCRRGHVDLAGNPQMGAECPAGQVGPQGPPKTGHTSPLTSGKAPLLSPHMPGSDCLPGSPGRWELWCGPGLYWEVCRSSLGRKREESQDVMRPTPRGLNELTSGRNWARAQLAWTLRASCRLN